MTTRQAAGIEPSGLQPPRLIWPGEKNAEPPAPIGKVVDVSKEDFDGLLVVIAPTDAIKQLLNAPPVWDRHDAAETHSVARSCPSKRRIGTFSITKDLVEDQCPSVMAALDGCVVVRCELNYGTNCFEYTALHDDFDEVPPGCAAIAYIPVLHVDHPDGLAAGPVYRRTWEKRTP